jgi:hypothetical protein
MLMWPWRNLSWPIVGIVFWWLAGRSIEALLSSRHKVLLPRIRWWEIVVSLPVLTLGAICTIGLFVCQIPQMEFPFRMLLVGFASMWLLLGASTPVAYFMQWRLRRHLTSSNVEQALADA